MCNSGKRIFFHGFLLGDTKPWQETIVPEPCQLSGFQLEVVFPFKLDPVFSFGDCRDQICQLSLCPSHQLVDSMTGKKESYFPQKIWPLSHFVTVTIWSFPCPSQNLSPEQSLLDWLISPDRFNSSLNLFNHCDSVPSTSDKDLLLGSLHEFILIQICIRR